MTPIHSQDRLTNQEGPVEVEPSRPRLTALKDCRHGRMLFLKRDQYIGRSLDLYGEFSELEARAFSQLLRADDVVVEAGANIGSHTVHIAKLVGTRGLVLAFEPQRVIHELLCANVALNELFHVRPYRAALGRDVGTIKVPLVDYAGENNFGGISLSQSSAGEEVPLLALDGFTLPSLRMLKVDVEGMEAEVLWGARQTIAKLRPILYLENDRQAQSEGLVRLIEELGYNMWWHWPPLFNPGNFANLEQNVFAGIVSINLLCIPKEMPTDISGLRPVAGPGDWP
jgi:FkbM family methyltransferase